MGIQHFTSQEIHDNRAYITDRLQKGSWIVHREQAESVLSQEISSRFGTDAQVAELGCASGLFLQALRQKGFTNVIGVDIDNYVVDPELAGKVKLADLNRDTFPLESASADAVVALEIFEHLENPWHVARECRRVLKPGGLLILSMPWGHTIWDKMRFFRSGNLVNYRIKNNHITFLTRDVFVKTFSHFQVERIIFQHGYIPFLYPRRWRKRLPAHPLWSLKACYVMTLRD